jgi:hypothetical protein
MVIIFPYQLNQKMGGSYDLGGARRPGPQPPTCVLSWAGATAGPWAAPLAVGPETSWAAVFWPYWALLAMLVPRHPCPTITITHHRPGFAKILVPVQVFSSVVAAVAAACYSGRGDPEDRDLRQVRPTNWLVDMALFWGWGG